MPDNNILMDSPEAERVVEILKNGLQFDDWGQSLDSIENDTLIAELAIDSLLLSELIFDLEDSFGIELTDDELMNLNASETIGQFIETFLDCCKQAKTLPVGPITQGET